MKDNMTIKFLANYPALFLSEKKTLVISDTHVGLEYQLFKDGIIIPSQAEKFGYIIEKLIDLTNSRELIILGDIKHKVPGISYREMKEIPKFFEDLVSKVVICITKGNHDDFIEKIIPKEVKIYSSKGFKVGKYGFFHGHAWPSEELVQCDYLFMGHIHPLVEFKDKFGYRNIEQVWIKGKLNKELVKRKYLLKKTGKLNLIIFPAFNKLLGGIPLNTSLKEELIGPLLANKFFDIDKSKVYLLDGTYLGNVKLLKDRI